MAGCGWSVLLGSEVGVVEQECGGGECQGYIQYMKQERGWSPVLY